MLNQLKLVCGPFPKLFGQSNMHRTLDFCLRPDRKETIKWITTLENLRAYCPNIYIYTVEIGLQNERRKEVKEQKIMHM